MGPQQKAAYMAKTSVCDILLFPYFNVKIFGFKVSIVSVTYVCFIVCQKIERKASTIATMANLMKIVSV